MKERATALLDSGSGLCHFGIAGLPPAWQRPSALLQMGISDTCWSACPSVGLLWLCEGTALQSPIVQQPQQLVAKKLFLEGP